LVGLGDDDGTGSDECLDDGGVSGRDVVVVGGAAAGGGQAGNVEEVFDRDWYAVELASVTGWESVEGVGLGERLVGAGDREGVAAPLRVGHGDECRLDAFPAGELELRGRV